MNKLIHEEQLHLNQVVGTIDKLVKEAKNVNKNTIKDTVDAQVAAISEKKIRQLKDHRNNPYFGRLDFQDDYGDETIYIGKKGIDDDGELVVVDWRTDLGKLFNAYQGVQSSFLLSQKQEITIKGKRGIVIKDAEVKSVSDIGKTEVVENEQGQKVKYMDEYLNEILTNTGEGHQLRDIIASIQSEQDEIIRLPLKDTVIVQGAAGSGKSTIALHRISYLLYQYHETLHSSDVLILAPNKIFLSYIKEVVPEIEIEGIEQRTFYDWASTHFTDVNDIPDLHEQYVALQQSSNRDELTKVAKYKGSLRLKKLLDDFVEYIGRTMLPHGDIVIDVDTILRKEDVVQYYESCEHLPLNQRMKKVKAYITEWSKKHDHSDKERIEEEFEHTYRTWVSVLPEGEVRKNLYDALEKARDLRLKLNAENMKNELSVLLKKMEDIPALLMYKSVFQKRVFETFHSDIEEDVLSLMLKNGKMIKQERFSYEDIAPLIYLDAKINGKKLQYEHIFIDEAQDYSPFQLAIMKDYAKSMTILGDIAQGIFSFYGLDRWEEIESYVFKEDELKRLYLQTSYRSTKQIMDLANRVILNSNYDFPLVIPVNRIGNTPHIKPVSSLGSLYDEMVICIEKFKKHGHNKIAILTNTKQDALDTYDQLVRRDVLSVEAIVEGNQTLREEVVIIPSYLVKGLEFDAVIIQDVSNETFKDETQHAKMLYMSITRAHHELQLFYRGTISPLLENRDIDAPPKPRKSFEEWLITDINDPYTEPQVEEMKAVQVEETLLLFEDDANQLVFERFNEDRERYYDFYAWLKVWHRWAELKKKMQ
ncbi:RNA polymerase recycling motor HelD [Peribacillus asahii]|uniref:RNA polymerase recycling motor HelD n=1 Tax=Peribacillus asahii TaxID=228899 RepID=UPI00207A898E|nr:RNA polymerase recycling motor HelD [Peribacillus asahii]USK68584.1 AAA family ATPase [Peribacillus asahii]